MSKLILLAILLTVFLGFSACSKKEITQIHNISNSGTNSNLNSGTATQTQTTTSDSHDANDSHEDGTEVIS